MSQFVHHRFTIKTTVHDRDLKMWAVEKAVEVGMPNFKASSHFISSFKKHHKIGSRHVTHAVTKRNLFPELSLQTTIDEFRKDLNKLIEQNKYEQSWILNTDQSAFQYEMTSKRTMHIKGAKNVESSVISKNKTKHSYTIQMTISADGHFVGPLLIILQEQKGIFGPQISKQLAETPHTNFLIKAPKRGKAQKN
jgi:hypothetical protein